MLLESSFGNSESILMIHDVVWGYMIVGLK
jgi:hypothetical protein